jgi:4'-phosphopantetheinyl transferase
LQGQVAANPADFEPWHVPLRGFAVPAENEIHLWFMDLDEMAGSLRAALGDNDEPADDHTFTGGQLTFTRRFFLRLLLGAYLGLPGKAIRIDRNRRGKPKLDPEVHGQDLHFSIAKSGNGFLVGVSSSSYLGVDVEPVGRSAHSALGVAKRYFSQTESAALAAMEPDRLGRAFLRTWSCKEAVVKAMGLGIANQLRRFTVETDPDEPAAILDFEGDSPEAWWLQLIRPADGFLGAVATRSKPVKLSSFRLLPARRDTDR